jgi:hypothetical protein
MPGTRLFLEGFLFTIFTDSKLKNNANQNSNVGKVTPQIPQKTTPQKVPSPNQKDTGKRMLELS